MDIKSSLPLRSWFWVLAVLLSSFGEPGFVKTKVSNNITLLLPEELQLMTDQDFNEKVITPRQSIALYTNSERRVDFAINQSTSSWSDSDFDLMKDFYKSSIMSLFSEIEFLREDVETINGRKFAVFEFISVVRDQKNAGSSIVRAVSKYNYIQYTLVDNKSLVFNLATAAVDKNAWSSRARTMMRSVKIK